MTNPVRNFRIASYPLGDVVQWFGENPKLYQQAMGLAAHNGWDIVRPHGEHMYAVEDGIVCAVKEEDVGHGKHIRLVSLAEENGCRRDWVYGHMSYIAVKNGQEVKAGQYIGNMGNTGFVVSGNTPYWEKNPYAGTHLHLGVRLIKPKRGGWKYDGIPTEWTAVNYENGYKGRIDPLQYFLDPSKKSTKIFRLASLKQDKTLLQLAELMFKIGL